MPGLFGAVAVNGPSAINQAKAKEVLSSMGEALAHTDQRCEYWSDSSTGIYVGRVGPDGFNTVPWSNQANSGSRNARVFVAGSLTKRPPPGDDDPSGIATAFVRHGASILEQLHGPFSVLAHATSPDETIIAADRCAHLPLYYVHLAGVLYFAPEIKALLRVPGLPRDLNFGSVATHMASGHSLGGQSLLSAVRFLRGGQALSIRDGRVDPFFYWRFRPGSEVDGTREEDLEVELGELITNAVRKNLDDPANTVIFLSGGADSRAILGGALEAMGGCGDQLRTVTWAADRKSAGSDAGVAQTLAKKFGLQHQVVDRKTGDYERDFEHSNWLIDGKSDMAALHPFEHQLMLDLRDDGCRRVFRGDQVFGQGGVRKVPAMTNEQALADCVLRRLRELDLASTYIRADVFEELAGACDVLLDAALEEVRDCEPKEARDTLYYSHRTQMFYNSSSYLKQVVFDARNILLDDDILEFLQRVPGPVRAYKRILHRAMRRRHPDLWSVPFATDNNLEDWDWQFGHDTAVRRYALEQLGDTSSGLWDLFDPRALCEILDSLAGHKTPPNPVTQRPVKRLVKNMMLKLAPEMTARVVIGREARFHPKNRILARVLALKHWYDSMSATR